MAIPDSLGAALIHLWKGRHWGSPSNFPDHVEKPASWNDMATREKLDFLDTAGLIHWPETEDGMPRFKRYLSTSKGAGRDRYGAGHTAAICQCQRESRLPHAKNPCDCWNASSLHHPIPATLCSTRSADVRLRAVAAEKLGRKWIGIDLSPVAADLVRLRVDKELTDILSSMGPYRYEIIHRTDIPLQTSGTRRSADIKHTLFGKQEGLCNGCREQFPFKNLTVDHIIPRAKGGQDTDSNLQLLCGCV